MIKLKTDQNSLPKDELSPEILSKHPINPFARYPEPPRTIMMVSIGTKEHAPTNVDR